jgi:hypothetical protein
MYDIRRHIEAEECAYTRTGVRRYARHIRESDTEPTADELAWMDRVWERAERRRGLPYRQLSKAIEDELLVPVLSAIGRGLRFLRLD